MARSTAWCPVDPLPMMLDAHEFYSTKIAQETFQFQQHAHWVSKTPLRYRPL